MDIKINNTTPSMSQLIDKKMIKPEKKPTVSISKTKPSKSYSSKRTKPLKSTNLKTLSYSAIVESEIKSDLTQVSGEVCFVVKERNHQYAVSCQDLHPAPESVQVLSFS